MQTIAKTLIYLRAAGGSEYQFDVDGEPFPWEITKDGASVVERELGDYFVTVRILPRLRSTGEAIAFGGDFDRAPELGGTEFPWFLTGPVVYHPAATPADVPMLELTFVAADVRVSSGV